jgi:hypothetical protein
VRYRTFSAENTTRRRQCRYSNDLQLVDDSKDLQLVDDNRCNLSLSPLVLLDANPVADVANLDEISAVFLNGKHYSRVALDSC